MMGFGGISHLAYPSVSPIISAGKHIRACLRAIGCHALTL